MFSQFHVTVFFLHLDHCPSFLWSGLDFTPEHDSQEYDCRDTVFSTKTTTNTKRDTT